MVKLRLCCWPLSSFMPCSLQEFFRNNHIYPLLMISKFSKATPLDFQMKKGLSPGISSLIFLSTQTLDGQTGRKQRIFNVERQGEVLWDRNENNISPKPRGCSPIEMIFQFPSFDDCEEYSVFFGNLEIKWKTSI